MSAQRLPEGFVLIEEPPGFGTAFGAVGMNRAAQKLGFYVGRQHLNPVSVCHGGAISTFADMQILAVTGDADAPDAHRPTISLTVDFLAPAPFGAWVEAAVTRLKLTRNLVFTQALITANGELVARSHAIYRNAARKISAT